MFVFISTEDEDAADEGAADEDAADEGGDEELKTSLY